MPSSLLFLSLPLKFALSFLFFAPLLFYKILNKHRFKIDKSIIIEAVENTDILLFRNFE